MFSTEPTMPQPFSRFPRAAIALLAAAAALAAASAPVSAATIIDEWSRIKTPAAPALEDVTVDAKTTALLLLDFAGAQDPSKGPCNSKTKPRCIASLPAMQALLGRSRAAHLYVVYSVAGRATRADIATAIAPEANDPVVTSGPDKFIGTDLGKLLAAKGIKTVIVTGTAAEGAVLDTATDAALHGMNVVVPVDGMSSTDPYAEQYVAWHLTHAPGVSSKTTLTESPRIRF
jgi:nicotinamidase-related amidase